MALGETDKAENTVRLKVDHDGEHRVPDLPPRARTRRLKACSRRSPPTDKEGKKAAEEHAKAPTSEDTSRSHRRHRQVSRPEFGKKYQIKLDRRRSSSERSMNHASLRICSRRRWPPRSPVASSSPQQAPLKSGLDPAQFDKSVRPQDDLFRHVNGAWLTKTEIPGRSAGVRHVRPARRTRGSRISTR